MSLLWLLFRKIFNADHSSLSKSYLLENRLEYSEDKLSGVKT